MTQESMYIPDNIFVQLGLANASEETKMALLARMNELIEKRLLARMLEGVSDEQRAQMEAVSNDGEGAEEKMFGVLVSFYPNFLEMVDEEVAFVRDEVKNSLAS